MIKRNYRMPRFNKPLPPKKAKDQITLRDILIPLVSAIVATFFNQFFFASNKVTESRIEIHKENLRIQRPILNRILAFTYKEQELHIEYIQQPFDVTTGIDSASKKVVFQKKKPSGTADTNTVSVYRFVADQTVRSKFDKELIYIRSNLELLDHQVYIKLDQLFTFLEYHPLPKPNDLRSVLKSDWKNKKTKEEWIKILIELRSITFEQLREFEEL